MRRLGALDEACELFLNQLKIVSYYLNVRPIAKNVEVMFGRQ